MQIGMGGIIQCLGKGGLWSVSLLVATLLSVPPAHAGMYSDSAHGDGTVGVFNAQAPKSPYARGNCAHCHEQHASIGGTEPLPSGGPDAFLLFDENHTDQTRNFCFDCHGGTYQAGGPVLNRTYSFRAGGYTADTVTSLVDAFGTSMASSHGLDDITIFLQNQSWGYGAASNPCTGCHNPHAAQGDPLAAGTSPKSSSSRGYPLSRPSQHANASTWGLWGDDAGETMSDYTVDYQAPYRYDSSSQYEPDGSAIQDGSNLTDVNTFCTDCHNPTNTIFSSSLGRNLRPIDWEREKHGRWDADVDIRVSAPYASGSGSLGYVLSCLDCHEPHGSPNVFLLRREVNGSALGAISSGGEFYRLCSSCHNTDWEDIHHTWADRAYAKQSPCGTCHRGSGGGLLDCSQCHFHGARSGGGNVPETTIGDKSRPLF